MSITNSNYCLNEERQRSISAHPRRYEASHIMTVYACWITLSNGFGDNIRQFRIAV